MLKLSSQDCTNCRAAMAAPDLTKSPFPCPRVLAVHCTAGVLFGHFACKAGKWMEGAQGQHHFRAVCVTPAMQHPSGVLSFSAFHRQLPWPPWKEFNLFTVIGLITCPKGKYHTLNVLLRHFLFFYKNLPPHLLFFVGNRSIHKPHPCSKAL